MISEKKSWIEHIDDILQKLIRIDHRESFLYILDRKLKAMEDEY